jgi:hypothetical protein
MILVIVFNFACNKRLPQAVGGVCGCGLAILDVGLGRVVPYV